MEWHDIRDPNSPELDQLAERYGLHSLHIEDCRHRGQIAKVEEDSHYIFFVLKPIQLDAAGELDISDLDIFLGSDFLITVQETTQPAIAAILDRVRAVATGLRPDQLLYRITDAVVDSYLPILDNYSDVLEELGDQVLENPNPGAVSRIFATKRCLIQIRRVLGNTRDVVGHLQRTECSLIARDLYPFLRDVYDHLARNMDIVEMHRDLLAGSLDIYLSSVANRTNQVMKVLTVLGTVVLPSLVISGLYGMNVHGLPWQESPYGAIIVCGMMLISTVAVLVMLRLMRWL